MDERSIILINGEPGSGKSTLGKNLAHRYHNKLEQENMHHPVRLHSQLETSHPLASHISLGQYIRDIYTGETESYYAAQIKKHFDSSTPYDLLDDTLANCLTLEAFLYHDNARLVFLDGYPRRTAQVDDMRVMSGDLGYDLRGMIMTDIDTDTAKARCLKRDRGLGKSALNNVANSFHAEEIVEQRFRTYQKNTPDMLDAIQKLNLPVEHVPTGGLKDRTLHLGEAAVERLLHRDRNPERLT
jgi:adenylate kinase family enzyme